MSLSKPPFRSMLTGLAEDLHDGTKVTGSAARAIPTKKY